MALTDIDGQRLGDSVAPKLSNRNLIINGAMGVAQRGGVDVTSGGGTTFTATDRYGLLNYWGSGQVGTSQSTETPSGFDNSLELEVDTAPPMSGSTGYSCNLCQTIEGYNIRHAYTGNITLTFWVRSSVIGTYSVTFSNSSTAISLGDRVYVTEYTVNTINTWEKKTITVDLSAGVASGTWNTTNGAGLGIHWNLGGESNRKGDTHLDSWGTLASANVDIMSADQVNWISNASATFYLTGVQLEVGNTATPFEHRSYDDELARCQRYCNRIQAYIGPDNGIIFNFPVEMRAAGASTVESGTVQNGVNQHSTTTCNVNNNGGSANTVIIQTIIEL